MVFLAPFALLALGGVSVVLLVAVWLRTAIRARALIAPFSAAGGALALSALLLTMGGATVAGLMIVRLGLDNAVSLGGAMLPMSAGKSAGWRSVWYSNGETQQRLKDGLAKAGIPFRTRLEGGKEYVSWPPEHDAAAEKIAETVRNMDATSGISFGSAETQKQFVAWLAKRSIKSDIVRRDGKDYVTWDTPASAKELMDAFIADQPQCPKQKAKC